MLKRLLTFVVAFTIWTGKAHAELTSLPQLETSTILSVLDTLSAALAFRPVEGATELGNLWGMYLGVGGSATDVSALTALGGSTTSAYLPSGDLQFGLGIKAFTFEMGMIPTLSYNGNSFSRFGASLKWTASRTLFKKFPISLAVRGIYAKSSIGYTQTSSGTTLDVDFTNSQYGLQLQASKFLGGFGFGIEPFVGLGLLNQSSTIGATGTGTLFGSSYPAGTTSITAASLGIWLQAGMMVRLGILSFAASYDQLYGNSGYAGKVGFRF